MDALKRMAHELDVAKHLHAGILANPNCTINNKCIAEIDDRFVHEIAIDEARRLLDQWNPPISGNEDKQ